MPNVLAYRYSRQENACLHEEECVLLNHRAKGASLGVVCMYGSAELVEEVYHRI